GGLAHDTGDDAAAVFDDDGNPVTPEVSIPTDARGFDRISGAHVDIGAFEQQLVVTTLNDGGADDFNGGDLTAELSDGGGLSLREALALANADPDADTITFQAGLTGTIMLASGELTILTDVTIEGGTPGLITIDGNYASRVFDVTAGTSTLHALTMTHG